MKAWGWALAWIQSNSHEIPGTVISSNVASWPVLPVTVYSWYVYYQVHFTVEETGALRYEI